MASGDLHVLPSGNGWRVEVEGSDRAQSTHSTQDAARSAACDLARKHKVELHFERR